MTEAPLISAAAPRKRRPHATAQEKADWAKRFAESGLKQREFCRQHGLVLTTLQRWLTQTSGDRQGSTQAEAQFVELKYNPSVAGCRWAAELCRSNGAILRLAHDIPPGLLQQLLRAC